MTRLSFQFQVDGQKYFGKGRSKKLARAEAAAVALRDFVQFKDSTAALALTPNDLKHVDFTSDEQLENGTHLLTNSLACVEPHTTAAGVKISPTTPLAATTTGGGSGVVVDTIPPTTSCSSNNTSSSIISNNNISAASTTKDEALFESVQRSLALHNCSKLFGIGVGSGGAGSSGSGQLTHEQTQFIDQLSNTLLANTNQPKEYWVQRLESKYFFYFIFFSLFFDFFRFFFTFPYSLSVQFFFLSSV